MLFEILVCYLRQQNTGINDLNDKLHKITTAIADKYHYSMRKCQHITFAKRRRVKNRRVTPRSCDHTLHQYSGDHPKPGSTPRKGVKELQNWVLQSYLQSSNRFYPDRLAARNKLLVLKNLLSCKDDWGKNKNNQTRWIILLFFYFCECPFTLLNNTVDSF